MDQTLKAESVELSKVILKIAESEKGSPGAI